MDEALRISRIRYTGAHPADVRAGDHILHEYSDYAVIASGAETTEGWTFWVIGSGSQQRAYYRRGESVMVRERHPQPGSGQAV